MLTQEELKRNRLVDKNIPTDSEGNLLLNNNQKVSGTKRRIESSTGIYHQKRHPERPNEELGVYEQFNFGTALPSEKQTDTPVDNQE